MADMFTGKVALITGAARGIGAGVARGYVAAGAAGSRWSGLEPELLGALSEELGDAAAWWEADVRDGARCAAAIDAAAEHFGRIDHVLANAGIASYGTVRQIDDEAFERVVDINVNGVFRTLKYATPHLAGRGATPWWSPRRHRSPRWPDWRRTTPARPAPSRWAWPTSKRSPTSASTSASATRPGSTPTSSATPSVICRPSARPARSCRGPPTAPPASRPASSSSCADFAKRKGRVYVPKNVLVSNWTKSLVNSPAGLAGPQEDGRQGRPRHGARGRGARPLPPRPRPRDKAVE